MVAKAANQPPREAGQRLHLKALVVGYKCRIVRPAAVGGGCVLPLPACVSYSQSSSARARGERDHILQSQMSD
jgi:hypothetical protein